MRRLALLAVAAVCLAGCGGEEDLSATGPGAAEVKVIENLYDGHYERAYSFLHPRHRRVVSRERFAYCAQQVTAVGELESTEILDVFDDHAKIPLLPGVDSKAVRVRATAASGESFVDVDHFVNVGDQWFWVLSQNAIDAYRRQSCPR